MKIRLRNVKWAWARDGKSKLYYHRPTKTRLPADPDSKEFQDRLRELNEQLLRPPQLTSPDAAEVLSGSWKALIDEYRGNPKRGIEPSVKWLKLKPRTRELYGAHLDQVDRQWGRLQVATTTREHCLAMQEALAKPRKVKIRVNGEMVEAEVMQTRKADTRMDVLSAIFGFALDRASRYGKIQVNPAFRIARLHDAGIGHPRWPEAVIAEALAKADKHFRRVIMLALYTGQRIGDVVAMTWAQYDGAGMQVTTQKTKRQLWIPCHPALKTMLDEAKAENTVSDTPSTHILLAPHNSQPWLIDWVKHTFTNFMRSIGQDGYSAHGLRKSACARLVEAGVADRDGAETVGMTLAMFQHYTKEVSQQMIATRSIAKLASYDQRKH